MDQRDIVYLDEQIIRMLHVRTIPRNICTMLDYRRRRWVKCFVVAGDPENAIHRRNVGLGWTSVADGGLTFS